MTVFLHEETRCSILHCFVAKQTLQDNINFADGRLCEVDFCEFVAEIMKPLITSGLLVDGFIKCLHDSITVSKFSG
jgi:hypothetical protein